MAKNQINFTKISEEAQAQLRTFKDTVLEIAKEDLRFKDEMKPLKARLESILENRKNDIKNGLPADEVIAKFSTVEVENEIRRVQTEHNAILEPLNKVLKDTYAFVPDNMYQAYNKKIDEHKRGDFLAAITQFLANLGIEGCTQGQISKLAENISDMFGAKFAQSKKIVEDGVYHTAISKRQFNKLFMAVFCDMAIK